MSHSLKKAKTSEFFNNISDLLTDSVIDINNLTSQTYDLILKSQGELEPLKNKLGVVSDMILDLNLLKGLSKNKISLVNENVYENNGIEIKDNEITLKTESKNNVVIVSDKSNIISLQNYSVFDTQNKQTNINNFLTYKQETNILFTNVGFTCELHLSLSNYELVNNLFLDLGKTAKVFPTIVGISYVNSELKTVEVPFEEKDLNEELTANNQYNIDFNSIFTKHIIIKFSNALSNTLTIANIEAFNKNYVEEGYVIFGPIITTSAVVKSNISMLNNSKNYKLELSNDLVTWHDMEVSNSLNLNNSNKIMSFNTINSKSFKTEEDVKTIYVKLTLTSELLDANIDSLKTLKTKTLRLNENLIPDKYSAYGQKFNDEYYGKSTIKKSLKSTDINLKNLSSLSLENNFVHMGLIDTEFTINPYTAKATNSIISQHKLIKKGDALFFCKDIDISTLKTYAQQCVLINQFTSSFNLEGIVLKLNIPEDIYTLTCENKILTLDFRSGYVENTYFLSIFVPDSKVVIRNSLNDVIKVIEKEQLSSYSLNNKEYKFIDLASLFYSLPVIPNYSYNPIPYLNVNAENSYYIENKVLKVDKEFEELIQYYSLVQDELTHKKMLSYVNGNYVKLDEKLDYLSYNETILNTSLKNSLKLNKTFIEKNSIRIETDSEITLTSYMPNISNKQTFLNMGSKESPQVLIAQYDENNDLLYYLQD